MAHDWSGLLGAVKAFAVDRRPLIDDEEEERRRRGQAQGASAGQAGARAHFRSTGLGAAKAGTQAGSAGKTISGLLNSSGSGREALDIIGRLVKGPHDREDEEERRRGGGGGGSGSGGGQGRKAEPKGSQAPARKSTRGPDASRMSAAATRAAVAAGAQPVVIKVTSTISSRASAAGLMTYLGTRTIESKEGGQSKVDIEIVDQDGVAIVGRGERSDAIKAWAADFREAYAVNSTASMTITPEGDVRDEALHDGLNAAFGDKPFLYARHADGQVAVYGVTDLNARALSAAIKARAKGEGAVRAVEDAERAVTRKLAAAGISATATIEGAAVSEASARYFLEKFLRSEKAVRSSTGDAIDRKLAVKAQADEVWSAWQPHMKTVEPRNAFHVVFSARAGTDAEAMVRAVRDFLGEQVAGRRWITAHHPDTGHVHVHAMIAARDHLGKPLRFTKPELYQWREKFAAKAREHGIAMVATRRADLAATRPFSQAQSGASERGRGDPRYLKHPGVIARVDRKRAGVVDQATLANGDLRLAAKWQASAAGLRQVGANDTVVAAADRFAGAAAVANQAVQARAQPKGFVLVCVALAAPTDQAAVLDLVAKASGADGRHVAFRDGRLILLAPVVDGVSRIEREIARQNDEIGPGGETQAFSRNLRARLKGHGLDASVSVEAAGSARDGRPTPWLSTRFDAEAGRSTASAADPFSTLKTLISDLKQRKDSTMPISLEQFDERVAKANKSMDRLETMVDSSAERQAVEEMRREVAAIFAEQRKEIELSQMPTAGSAGEGSNPPPAQAPSEQSQTRSAPVNIDPAIAAQQQAIAAGRAARASESQAAAAKGAQQDKRQQAVKLAEQDRQRENGRDGAER